MNDPKHKLEYQIWRERRITLPEPQKTYEAFIEWYSGGYMRRMLSEMGRSPEAEAYREEHNSIGMEALSIESDQKRGISRPRQLMLL